MTDPVVRPGIRSETLAQIGITYDDYPSPRSIRIPYYSIDGDPVLYTDAQGRQLQFARWRLDKKYETPEKKYHQLTGSPSCAYHPPTIIANTGELALVEGEFKYLSLFEEHIAGLGLPNFCSYKREGPSKERKLVPEIRQAIAQVGPKVIFLLGDNDTASNLQFAMSAAFLADAVKPIPVLLPRLSVSGPKGVDDFKEACGSAFTTKLAELLAKAYRADPDISYLLLQRDLIKIAQPDFGLLAPGPLSRHKDRLLRLCAQGRLWNKAGGPDLRELEKLVREIVGAGKRDFENDVQTQIQILNTQWARANNQSTNNPRYPIEFANPIQSDGLPAVFVSDEAGLVQKAILLEPFWGRLYVEQHNIVFIQETGEFRQYDSATGVWQFMAPSALKQGLSELVRKYARSVALLASLDEQRSSRILENLRHQVANKSTVPDPFRKRANFIHLGDSMLLWNPKAQQFEKAAFNKDFYSTGRIDVAWNPDAKCPRFLDKLLKASLTDQDINLLQRWLGMVVLGFNPAKKILLCIGERDRGKTQLAQLATLLAGQGKFSLLRTKYLEDRFELGNLRNSSLLYGADVDSNFLMHPGVDLLKSLVGGDPLTCEVKYGTQPVELSGVFNVCLTTNEVLRIKIGFDPESWRNRLWIIEFCKRDDFKLIPNFAEQLWKDEAAGIVAFAVQGARNLLFDLESNGKVELYAAQQGRIDKLIAESVSVREFVRRCILLQQGADLTTEELFEAYRDFCQEQKIRGLVERKFQEDIRQTLEQELQVNRSNCVKRQTLYNGQTLESQRRGYFGICLNPNWLNSTPSN